MRIKGLLLLMVVFLLTPVFAKADTETPIEKLDTISDEALQMVKYQKYDEAERLLDYFSAQFSVLNETDLPLTMDEVRIVNVSCDEAKAAAVSSNMNYQEKISILTKFRLVIDAISNKNHPLWTGMEDPIMAAYNQAKNAAENHDSRKFTNSYNSFLSLYNVIYPSLKIDVPIEEIQQLDARVHYIDEYRSQVVGNSAGVKEMTDLGAELKKIFDEVDQDQADPSLWWVIISTGSIIIMTLSYVGLRKYQGEKSMKKDRSREYKD